MPAREQGARLDALRADAAAMGCELADDAPARLAAYLELLQRWNRVHNLTALRDPEQAWTHHLLDSLSVVAPLARALAARSAPVLLDVGSGGGLPGVVLAVVRPDWAVVTVDAVAKKAGFVRQAALELGLANLRAEHARVEALAPAQADVVVSRAFASLDDFTRLSRRHLAPHGVWAAMKGRRPDDEVAVLGPDVDVFHVEPLVVPHLGAERHLVWMRPAQTALRSTAATPLADPSA